jgi:hypothetical protein
MRFGVLVMAMALCLADCVTVSVGPLTPSPTSNGTTRTVTPGKGYGVGPDHNGGIIALDPDTDLVRLVLEDGWDWSVQVDPTFLRLQQYGPVHGQGFTAQLWLYKLLRAGETRITATGTPMCRTAANSCADPDRFYSVTIRTR